MIIDNILLNNANFKQKNKIPDFIALFKELYKISLFKPSLDAVVSLAEANFIKFQFDDNIDLHGCCITQKKTVFNSFFSKFTSHHHHIIQIKTLTADVLMHEMAHALEYQSKINIIKSDFPLAFKEDIKNLENKALFVKQSVQQILYKEIALYPKEQQASEFLARYFELLAMSKYIGIAQGKEYHFNFEQISQALPNVTKWIRNIFNESIKTKVRDHIANASKNIKYDSDLNSFVRKIKREIPKKAGGWSKQTGSIFGHTSNQQPSLTEQAKRITSKKEEE